MTDWYAGMDRSGPRCSRRRAKRSATDVKLSAIHCGNAGRIVEDVRAVPRWNAASDAARGDAPCGSVPIRMVTEPGRGSHGGDAGLDRRNGKTSRVWKPREDIPQERLASSGWSVSRSTTRTESANVGGMFMKAFMDCFLLMRGGGSASRTAGRGRLRLADVILRPTSRPDPQGKTWVEPGASTSNDNSISRTEGPVRLDGQTGGRCEGDPPPRKSTGVTDLRRQHWLRTTPPTAPTRQLT